MIPSLQQLSIETKWAPNDLEDQQSRRSVIFTQLRKSQILYAIQTDSDIDQPVTSEAGVIDSGAEKQIKTDITAIKQTSHGAGQRKNTGAYNTGVVEKAPPWFDIKTYLPMTSEKFRFIDHKVNTNDMFFRWTLNPQDIPENEFQYWLEKELRRLM